MPENVLILNGSPRKNGNTAYLIGKLIEGLREAHPDAQAEVVNLASMKIAPCRACDACRREDRLGQYCVFRDDMAGMYEKVLKADAIVIASPIYWFTMTAQTKLFMDRLYGLWLERTHAFRGKTFAAVMVYGDADPYISGAVNAIRTIEDACRYCGARLAGIVYGTANDIGDAAKNPELQQKARMLGKLLLSPAGDIPL
jgi:multimeric flavodoxin WrbA